MRILLLLIIGLFFATTVLRALGATVAFAVDLRKGAAHAPEMLADISVYIVISLVLGWLLRKIYLQKKKA